MKQFSKALFAASLVSLSTGAWAAPISLGAADDYTVLHLGGKQLSMSNGQTLVEGNVGLMGDTASQSKLNFSDGQITGNLRIDDEVSGSTNVGNVVVAGYTVVADYDQAYSDALSASQQIAALSADYTFNGKLDSPMTFNSVGNVTVLNVNGEIKLDGSETLTLSGSASDHFYINVYGKYGMSGTSSIDLVGLSAANVIFNILNGGDVSFSGDSFGRGTYLGVDSKFALNGNFLTGAIVGGRNEDIQITSGTQIYATQAVAANAPGTLMLLGLAVSGLMMRRRKA